MHAPPPPNVLPLTVALAVAPPFWPERNAVTAAVSLPAPAYPGSRKRVPANRFRTRTAVAGYTPLMLFPVMSAQTEVVSEVRVPDWLKMALEALPAGSAMLLLAMRTCKALLPLLACAAMPREVNCRTVLPVTVDWNDPLPLLFRKIASQLG